MMIEQKVASDFAVCFKQMLLSNTQYLQTIL